ncbi:MAG: hypothetical protein DRP16_03295 [Candidatus Aenigmatarchaeota archaeon]|nr:MAG: hypothetical protein DRP16_03295 [Candidatus Aenigmarchaeota archaeon]
MLEKMKKKRKLKTYEEKDFNIFFVGFDWIKTGDSLVLLEMNLGPGGSGYSPIYSSRLNYFLHFSVPKTHQHRVFGDLMPEFCSNKEKFSEFIKRNKHRGVVYKKDIEQRGEGVSVFLEPKWKPDLLEVYVDGERYKDSDGKEYAMVLRNVIEVVIEDNNLKWKQKRAFKKISNAPIDRSCEDPNEKLRVNVMNPRYPSRKFEITNRKYLDILFDSTCTAIERLIEKGEYSLWDARRAFPDKAILLRFNDYYGKETIDAIQKTGYHVCDIKLPEYIPFEKALDTAKYGVDGLLFSRSYSFRREDDPTHKIHVVINEDEIPSCSYIFEPKRNNFKEIALQIIEEYHKNRKFLT